MPIRWSWKPVIGNVKQNIEALLYKTKCCERKYTETIVMVSPSYVYFVCWNRNVLIEHSRPSDVCVTHIVSELHSLWASESSKKKQQLLTKFESLSLAFHGQSAMTMPHQAFALFSHFLWTSILLACCPFTLHNIKTAIMRNETEIIEDEPRCWELQSSSRSTSIRCWVEEVTN